jgi:hypothetical protein
MLPLYASILCVDPLFVASATLEIGPEANCHAEQENIRLLSGMQHRQPAYGRPHDLRSLFEDLFYAAFLALFSAAQRALCAAAIRLRPAALM